MKFKKWIILSLTSSILPIVAISCKNTKAQESAEKQELSNSISRAYLKLGSKLLDNKVHENLQLQINNAQEVLNNPDSTNADYASAASKLIEYYTKTLLAEEEAIKSSKKQAFESDLNAKVAEMNANVIVQPTAPLKYLDQLIASYRSLISSGFDLFGDEQGTLKLRLYKMLTNFFKYGKEANHKLSAYFNYKDAKVVLQVRESGENGKVVESVASLSIKDQLKNSGLNTKAKEHEKVQLVNPDETNGYHDQGNPNSDLKVEFDLSEGIENGALLVRFKLAFRKATDDYTVLPVDNSFAYAFSLKGFVVNEELLNTLNEVDELYSLVYKSAIFNDKFKEDLAGFYKAIAEAKKTNPKSKPKVTYKYDPKAKTISVKYGKTTITSLPINLLPEGYSISLAGNQFDSSSNALILNFALSKDGQQYRNSLGKTSYFKIDLSKEMAE
ncbi:hypothetical protein [Mycoplasmopsis glycophila]|uniref:Lipoprotein n=1 Tax=Mycoplasmopsis glycophila TaxID=171285 RepID=A0A449AW59_9BACT|nr:hypothetical protein [Mycoplasmopsis glycophila]VEU70903.1 Uncharacterised protein [Mycoplasmopsis glycophila]